MDQSRLQTEKLKDYFFNVYLPECSTNCYGHKRINQNIIVDCYGNEINHNVIQRLIYNFERNFKVIVSKFKILSISEEVEDCENDHQNIKYNLYNVQTKIRTHLMFLSKLLCFSNIFESSNQREAVLETVKKLRELEEKSLCNLRSLNSLQKYSEEDDMVSEEDSVAIPVKETCSAEIQKSVSKCSKSVLDQLYLCHDPLLTYRERHKIIKEIVSVNSTSSKKVNPVDQTCSEETIPVDEKCSEEVDPLILDSLDVMCNLKVVALDKKIGEEVTDLPALQIDQSCTVSCDTIQVNTVQDYTVNEYVGQEIAEVTNTCPGDTSIEDLCHNVDDPYDMITLFKSVSKQSHSTCSNIVYKLVLLKQTRREEDEKLKQFRLRNLMFLLLLNIQ